MIHAEVVRQLVAETSDGWVATATVAEQEAGVAILRLLVEPRGEAPRGGLASGTVKTALQAIRAAGRAEFNRDIVPPPSRATDRLPLIRPGRVGRRRDEKDYAALAIAYEALVRGGNRQPVVTLAERCGFSHSQMRDFIHRARVRGFLTFPPRHGVRGGAATRKAWAVWEGEG